MATYRDIAWKFFVCTFANSTVSHETDFILNIHSVGFAIPIIVTESSEKTKFKNGSKRMRSMCV